MKKYSLALLVFCAASALGYYDPSLYSTMDHGAAAAPRTSAMKQRSRSAIEKDIKATEKKIADIDKQIKTSKNTQTIARLRSSRASQANKLKRLETELRNAAR